jgi:hypothetical protein
MENLDDELPELRNRVSLPAANPTPPSQAYDRNLFPRFIIHSPTNAFAGGNPLAVNGPECSNGRQWYSIRGHSLARSLPAPSVTDHARPLVLDNQAASLT